MDFGVSGARASRQKRGARFVAVTQNIDTDERKRAIAGVRNANAAGKPLGRPKRVFRLDDVPQLREQGLS